MADVTVTATQVRPLDGCLTRRIDAGEETDLGCLVRVAADGDAEQADASSAAGVAGVLGIVVAGSANDDDGDVADGESITIAIWGAVYLGEDAGLDETATYYASETAGKIADTAPTVKRPVGHPLSGTVLFFNPDATPATS